MYVQGGAMFKLTVLRPGKVVNTYIQHNVLGTLSPKYKEVDRTRLKAFLKSASPGDSLKLKDRAGKQTTLTRTR